MPDERLRIVIEALDKATADLKGLQKELGGVGAAAKKADKNIVDTTKALASFTGAGIAAAAAMKKLYDFGKQGAAIAQTTESFDRLGVSIESLRASSLNTIDDMTLMSSTLTLTAGASEDLQAQLLDSAPRLLEIAKAANKLNPALGDTAFMYNSIATGVKRASPLILDNLGIMVKVGDANESYAEQLGKTVEQLTAEEKQIALLNATMEAGDRLIDQVGGSTEALGDSYAQLETNVKDISDAMKVQVSEAIGPLIQSYSDFIQKTIDGDKALIGFAATIRMVNELLGTDEHAFYAYQKAAVKAKKGVEDLTSAEKWRLDLLKEMQKDHQYAIQQYNIYAVAAETMAGAQLKVAATTGEMNDAAVLAAQTFAWMTSETLASQDALSNFQAGQLKAKRVAGEYNVLITAMGSGWKDVKKEYEEGRGDLATTLREQREELAKLEAGHGAMVTIQEKNTMSESELNLAQLRRADTLGKLNEAEAGSLSQASLQVKYEKLGAKIDAATGAQTAYVNNSKKISEVTGEIDAIIAKLAELEEAHRTATGNILLGFAQQEAAADGVVTQEELDFIYALGEAYGLLDEDAAIALGSLRGNMDDVRTGIKSADDAVDDLQGAINGLKGRDVIINIIEKRTSAPGYAESLPGAFDEQIVPPGNADGTDNWRGGMSWVGERGPELVNLPRGSQVHDAQTSQSIVNNNHDYGGLTINTPQVSNQFEQEWAYLQAISQ